MTYKQALAIYFEERKKEIDKILASSHKMNMGQLESIYKENNYFYELSPDEEEMQEVDLCKYLKSKGWNQ